MNTPLLSIVIPLYNCASYIERCLTSLLHQDIVSEVIVVDDGSTDGGDSIVENFALYHYSIRLIRQNNAGPSAARNRGLNEAKGKYVYFMDADDFLKKCALKQIVNLLEEYSAQVARFGVRLILEEDLKELSDEKKASCKTLAVSDVFNGIEYVEHSHAMAGVTLTSHIFLREFLNSSQTRLNERLFLEEDYVWLFNLLLHADKVIFCSGDKPYIWVKRLSSSSNQINSRAFDSFLDLFKAYRDLLDIYTDATSSVCRDFIYVRLASAMQFYLFNLAKRKQKDKHQ